jgi:hypothetical protein
VLLENGPHGEIIELEVDHEGGTGIAVRRVHEAPVDELQRAPE